MCTCLRGQQSHTTSLPENFSGPQRSHSSWNWCQEICKQDKTHPPQACRKMCPKPQQGAWLAPSSFHSHLSPSLPFSLLPSTSNYLVQLLLEVIYNSIQTEIARAFEFSSFAIPLCCPCSCWWVLRQALPWPRVRNPQAGQERVGQSRTAWDQEE